jgi:hypothetical protein
LIDFPGAPRAQQIDFSQKTPWFPANSRHPSAPIKSKSHPRLHFRKPPHPDPRRPPVGPPNQPNPPLTHPVHLRIPHSLPPATVPPPNLIPCRPSLFTFPPPSKPCPTLATKFYPISEHVSIHVRRGLWPRQSALRRGGCCTRRWPGGRWEQRSSAAIQSTASSSSWPARRAIRRAPCVCRRDAAYSRSY